MQNADKRIQIRKQLKGGLVFNYCAGEGTSYKPYKQNFLIYKEGLYFIHKLCQAKKKSKLELKICEIQNNSKIKQKIFPKIQRKNENKMIRAQTPEIINTQLKPGPRPLKKRQILSKSVNKSTEFNKKKHTIIPCPEMHVIEGWKAESFTN